MPSSVTLSWAGLAVVASTVVGLVALRDPPFPELDSGRASARQGGEEGAEDGSNRSRRERSGAEDSDDDKKPAGKDKPKPDAQGATPKVELPSVAARELAKEFEQRLRKNDLNGALTAFEALVEADKSLLKESSTREAVVDLSQRVTKLAGGQSARFFNVLATQSGPVGLDILYYLVTAKGGSQASRDAARLLTDPEVLERGSDAMQVAYLLFKAPCAKKPEYFERAGTDGDSRALGWLYQLDGKRCRRGGCCVKNNKELDAAVEAMKVRGIAN